MSKLSEVITLDLTLTQAKVLQHLAEQAMNGYIDGLSALQREESELIYEKVAEGIEEETYLR